MIDRTVYVWFPTHLEPEALAAGPHLVYPKANPNVGETTYCNRRMLAYDISKPYSISIVVSSKLFCLDCVAAYMAEELRGEDIRDADG